MAPKRIVLNEKAAMSWCLKLIGILMHLILFCAFKLNEIYFLSATSHCHLWLLLFASKYYPTYKLDNVFCGTVLDTCII